MGNNHFTKKEPFKSKFTAKIHRNYARYFHKLVNVGGYFKLTYKTKATV